MHVTVKSMRVKHVIVHNQCNKYKFQHADLLTKTQFNLRIQLIIHLSNIITKFRTL